MVSRVREIHTYFEVRGFISAQDQEGYAVARFRHESHAEDFVSLVLELRGQQSEGYKIIKVERTFL